MHMSPPSSFKQRFYVKLKERDNRNDIFPHLLELQERFQKQQQLTISSSPNLINKNQIEDLQSQILNALREKARMMDQMTELSNYLQSVDKQLEQSVKEKSKLEEENKYLKEQVELHKREADLFLIEIERRDQEIKTMDNYQIKYQKEVHSIKNNDYLLNEQIKSLQSSIINMTNYINKLNNENKLQMINVYNELEQEKQKCLTLEQQLNLSQLQIRQLKILLTSNNELNKNNDLNNELNYQLTQQYNKDQLINHYELYKDQQQLLTDSLNSFESILTTTTSPMVMLDTTEISFSYLNSVKANDNQINRVCYNSKSSIFASGSEDGIVMLWKTKGKEFIKTNTIRTATKGITSISFSNDRRKVLISSKDSYCRVHDVKSGALYSTLKGHSSTICNGYFYENDTKAITGSHDKTIKLWDIHYQKCIKTLLSMSKVNAIELLSDSICISAHFDKRIRLYDVRTYQKTMDIESSHTEQITSISISPDRNMILTTSKDNTLKLFDSRTLKEIQTLSHPKYFCNLETKAYFRPNCNHIVAVPTCVNSFLEDSSNGTVLFNLLTNSSHLLPNTSKVIDIAFNKDGNRLVCGTIDGSLDIFEQFIF
ncbi:hypothetical protein ABK040_005439 [Willaertia magna]